MASSATHFNYTDYTFQKPVHYDDDVDQSLIAVYSFVAFAFAVTAYNISSLFLGKKVRGRPIVESTKENNTRGLYGQPSILGIGTANPPFKVHKDKCDEFVDGYLKKGMMDEEQAKFVKKIRDTCGIEYRYSGVDVEEHFRDHTDQIFGKTLDEGVERRNLYWAKYAKETAIEASRKAIENWGGDKKKITHVVFHSCTGFKAPGIELDVVDALDLTGVKRRLGINFMGCFGGFTAMSVAKSFCLSDPGAITLIICAESCAAHMSNTKNRSELLGSVIFADGAAACLVGPGQYGDWALGDAMTKTLGTDTRDMMTWFPSDTSYRMYLSKEIGNQFGVGLLMTVRGLVKSVLGKNVSVGNAEWCVHPGGRGLLDGLSKGIGSKKLFNSYEVLKNYGNMSSPTIFFVIKRMFDEARESQSKQDAICIGFGPGLTCELCALHKVM